MFNPVPFNDFIQQFIRRFKIRIYIKKCSISKLYLNPNLNCKHLLLNWPSNPGAYLHTTGKITASFTTFISTSINRLHSQSVVSREASYNKMYRASYKPEQLLGYTPLPPPPPPLPAICAVHPHIHNTHKHITCKSCPHI